MKKSELTKEDIRNILILLKRTTMSGEEAPAYMIAVSKLESMYNASDTPETEKEG